MLSRLQPTSTATTVKLKQHVLESARLVKRLVLLVESRLHGINVNRGHDLQHDRWWLLGTGRVPEVTGVFPLGSGLTVLVAW